MVNLCKSESNYGNKSCLMTNSAPGKGKKPVIYSMSITPSKPTMMEDHTFYDVLALKTDFEGLKILKSWVNG